MQVLGGRNLLKTLTKNNMDVQGLNCCAIREIDGLSNSYYTNNMELAFKDFCNEFYDYQSCWSEEDDEDYFDAENGTGAFVVFSQVEPNQYGTNFAEYIRKNKLGRVSKSRKKLNPNSYNYVTMFVWEINRKKTFTFYKKLKK
jgi:hypothetical protein